MTNIELIEEAKRLLDLATKVPAVSAFGDDNRGAILNQAVVVLEQILSSTEDQTNRAYRDEMESAVVDWAYFMAPAPSELWNTILSSDTADTNPKQDQHEH